MRLLAIDTALDACSVAVLDGDGGEARVTRATEVIGRGHAERLMPMIAEIMAEGGVSFSGLDRIVVTTGPGSFTGLRVGLSAARGIALVVRVPVVGVTTLAALAEEARGQVGYRADRPLAVVLAARGDEVYTQGFSADGVPAGPPQVATVAALAGALAPTAQLFGSGAGAVAAAAQAEGRAGVLGAAAWPDIAAVARLGARAKPDGSRPEPLYLRSPDARPAVRDARLLA